MVQVSDTTGVAPRANACTPQNFKLMTLPVTLYPDCVIYLIQILLPHRRRKAN